MLAVYRPAKQAQLVAELLCRLLWRLLTTRMSSVELSCTSVVIFITWKPMQSTTSAVLACMHSTCFPLVQFLH